MSEVQERFNIEDISKKNTKLVSLIGQQFVW
jgi:hypothetical protein